MRLALLRHPAIAVAPGHCYGRRDYPIADGGDIVRIVARLDGFRPETVRASPAGRCRGLAEAIPAPRTIFDPRLQELDFGAWEGCAWAAIDRAALDRWAADPVGRAPPGGERGAALIARVAAVFDDIVAAGEDQAVVTHGGPLKVLTCLARGRPVDLASAAPPLGSLAVVTL